MNIKNLQKTGTTNNQNKIITNSETSLTIDPTIFTYWFINVNTNTTLNFADGWEWQDSHSAYYEDNGII